MTARAGLLTRACVLALIAGCTATSGKSTPVDAAAGSDNADLSAGAGGEETTGGTTGSNDESAGAGQSGSAGEVDPGAAGAGSGFRSLFNGLDFNDWDRYLGKPSAAEPALGLNHDPSGVYSIVTVDGAPAIRVSGEVWGALISQEEYCDFELRLEYKWGTQTWPPLNAFDSGIMLLSTGPLGAVNAGGPALSDPPGSGAFMVSLEYQITPGDVGGLYNLGPITFSGASREPPSEQPGTWNQVSIVHRHDTATFLLNGAEVAQASGFRLAWPGQPESALTCGKLQLQSEGGEILFRGIEIQVFE